MRFGLFPQHYACALSSTSSSLTSFASDCLRSVMEEPVLSTYPLLDDAGVPYDTVVHPTEGFFFLVAAYLVLDMVKDLLLDSVSNSSQSKGGGEGGEGWD